MKNSIITAIGMAVLAMASCSKESYPSTLPSQKIAGIYEASTIKTEMFMAGEWKTMSNKTNERQLAHEFTWEGNELESMTDHNLGRFYSFGYDEKGRIDHIYSNSDQDFSRVISYDRDGHVVLSKGTIRMGNGTLLASQDFTFTWTGGTLQKVEEEFWSHYPDEEEINLTATRTYTWENGNVVKTVRSEVRNGSPLNDTVYTYEYGTEANPLYGFVYTLHPSNGIIFDYEGIDCLSRNLPSRIMPGNDGVRYEYSYSGSPLAKAEKHMIGDTSPIMHMFTDFTLDFEYVK